MTTSNAPEPQQDEVGLPERLLARVVSSHAASAPASALFAGFGALIAVNTAAAAAAAMGGGIGVGSSQAFVAWLYDAGQLLGLATLAWLVLRGLSPLRRAARVGASAALLVAVLFFMLDSDLESFVTRHGYDDVPWRLCFALLGALGIAGSFALGALSHARGPARVAGIALGLAAALTNHVVLPLDYPGAHFVLGSMAAVLIGASAAPWVASLRPPRPARYALHALCALSLLSYAVRPGPVVYSALMQRSGAISAPFVAQLWARLAPSTDVVLAPHDPAWWGARAKLPKVRAERLPHGPANPIVILLTIDGLRADVLTDPKAEASVPNLLEMAAHGARFDRVWSPASYTMASLRSLFIGAYYLQQSGRTASRNRTALGQVGKVRSRPSLAALLDKGGVATLNVRTQEVFSNRRGIGRGFREELAVGERANSKFVIAALLEHLPRGTRGPKLLYSHILDPHAPYELGGRSGSPKQRYLGEVAFVDARLGKLRAALRERGLLDHTYLIVTSDHGEAFGEHGRNYHATTVYEEMIRIPLLIEGPGIAPRRVQRPVTLLDVGPTVLSLFGVDTPASFMGESLQSFLRGEDPSPSRPLAVDGGRAIRAMLFDERWKAIVDFRQGSEELYDLKTDPKERRNLAEQPKARVYLDTLRAFFASLNPRAQE